MRGNQKKAKLSPQVERALWVYDRRRMAGESLAYDDMELEAGVSSSAFSRAIAIRMAEDKIATEQAIALSKSAAKKLVLAIRRATRELDMQYETRVRNEAKKLLDEWHIPDYLKTLRTVQTMLKWKRGIMSRAEYVRIIRCLHPDTGAHVTDENRNEAFRLFTQYEARLVDDNEQVDLKRVSNLPSTVEELLARKRSRLNT
jgi:hypothetical protein